MREIEWITDCGHEWLKVPIKEAQCADKVSGGEISTFSYRDTRYAYLEGDCDARIWAQWKGLSVSEVRAIPCKNYENEAPCRNMARYK
jgi:hypothetical protein